ncbi:MAG: GNAT family N-acetyltransferase [Amaricoccus sp.]
MTPEDLAALHALCFTDTPRPWSAPDFAGLLALTSTVLVERPGGFALGQIAGPEATLLTLAVHPEGRRQGLGRGLVAGFETAALALGALDAFLEVAESNAAAWSLYAGLGYQAIARRRGYYLRAAQPPVDAVVMRKPLAPVMPEALGKTI